MGWPSLRRRHGGAEQEKRRRELGLLRRETATQMGISRDTYVNWEKGKTGPVAAQFRPVMVFLGYDPTPQPSSLADRVKAKRRTLGATNDQVAQYLRWDPGSLRRYLNEKWQLSADRVDALERFLRLGDDAVAAILAPASPQTVTAAGPISRYHLKADSQQQHR